ncbi:class I SAM-dependent methyltransferase, partial [Tenacibaculum maritimum]
LLKAAYIQNAKNVNTIKNLLKDRFSLSSFENTRLNSTDNVGYTLKDFIYLRRDWTFLSEGEKQLDITISNIRQELIKIDFPKENALFIGCGVGRIAFDLSNLFKKTYATDKSFSMIWHLQKLLNGESITFYNPHVKNVFKKENIAQKYIAKIPDDKLSANKNKLEAFISDVLDLPFQDETVNSIFSIYFTDVIALKLWFNHINSKLSNSGLFIHFGPLDYFFSDEREMLTAEEFRLFFEENGYTTLVDKVIETPHLEDSNSITYKVYRNWFFIAQKNEHKEHVINNDTILHIKKPISYERKGVIKEGEKEVEVLLKLPNGVFKGAESVIQILKLIDGKNSFEKILLQLKKNGFEVNNPDEIKNLLIAFLNQRILSVHQGTVD